MKRYATFAAPPKFSDWDNDEAILEGRTVYVESDEPVKTGLVDALGVPIYRLSNKIKPGFNR